MSTDALQYRSPRSGWRHRGLIAAAVLVLVGAAALRCHAVSARGLWTDEYITLECSDGFGRTDVRVAGTNAVAVNLVSLADARPWTTIWSSMAADENHPPLYFLILRAWRTAFGDSVGAVRSLSVVASVAAVALVMATGAELGGPAAGLWAGLVMAVAIPQLREAQDARAYMPVTAAAAAALLAVVRITHRGPNRARVAGLFVALLVMPLMHYMALATVGTVAVYGAVGLRGPARRAVLGATIAAVAVYAVCWGPHLLGQHKRMADATEWLVDSPDGHTLRTIVSLLSDPVRLVVGSRAHLGPATAVTAGLALVVALVSTRVARRRYGSDLLLLWLWVVIPAAVAGVIDLATGKQSLSLAKYTLAGGPGVYLAVGLIAAAPVRLAWAVGAAVVLACVPYVPQAYHPPEPDWRPMAAAVAAWTVRADPVVIVASGDPESAGVRLLAMQYCLAADDARRDLYVLAAPPTGAAGLALARAGRVCLVAGTVSLDEIDRYAPGRTIRHADLFFGLGTVATVERPPRPALAVHPRPPS